MTQEQKPQTPEPEMLKPEDIFRTLATIRKTAKPLEPLWGFFLFKKAITSIVGDPGVCKTTFGYGLGTSLCLGKDFLTIQAEEPIKVLYMDFESADSLVVSRSNLIMEDQDIPNFYIYNIVDYYLPHVASLVIQFCKDKSINLIFVDSQSFAFNTRDENDNAEAIRQMRFVRSFAVASNTAVIIFHHTSKGNLPGTRKGTGAYARARLADVCLNIDDVDEENRKVVRLQMVKNRLVDEQVLWYLRKEKGQFVFTDPPLGVAGVQTDTMIYKAQRTLLGLINGKQEFKFNELVGLMGGKGFSEHWTDHALRRLLQLGRVYKPRYSYYAQRSVRGI